MGTHPIFESDFDCLTEKYKNGRNNDLKQLFQDLNKAKELSNEEAVSQAVKRNEDKILEMESAVGLEVDLCKECIEWARQEKRNYLRQALEARLMSLYFDTKQFNLCLALGKRLYSELKKLDDKALLVEIQLTES